MYVSIKYLVKIEISVINSLWEIRDIEDIFDVSTIEFLLEKFELLLEFISSWGTSQLLNGALKLSGLFGVHGLFLGSSSNVPLGVKGIHLVLEFHLFLLNLSESRVIHVEGWEWLGMELKFSIVDIDNINEFVDGLLGHLFEFSILILGSGE